MFSVLSEVFVFALLLPASVSLAASLRSGGTIGMAFVGRRVTRGGGFAGGAGCVVGAKYVMLGGG